MGRSIEDSLSFLKKIGFDLILEEDSTQTRPTQLQNQPKKTQKTGRGSKFFTEFAEELDVFDSEREIPDWVFEYRENILSNLSYPLKRICRYLRDCREVFKIKYPIHANGKWKYADVYLPNKNMIIFLGNKYSKRRFPEMKKRSRLFKGRYRVFEVKDLMDLEDKLTTAAVEWQRCFDFDV